MRYLPYQLLSRISEPSTVSSPKIIQPTRVNSLITARRLSVDLQHLLNICSQGIDPTFHLRKKLRAEIFPPGRNVFFRRKKNGSKNKMSNWSNWKVVSTHLKNISQNGNLPQIEVKIKNIWNHHPVYYFLGVGWGTCGSEKTGIFRELSFCRNGNNTCHFLQNTAFGRLWSKEQTHKWGWQEGPPRWQLVVPYILDTQWIWV